MKQWKLKKEAGFTLIEMIASLVILGILAIALSSAIMYGVGNLIYTREADQLSQKAQLAMARLDRELVDVRAISSVSANQINYTLSSDGNQYTILMANGQITLQQGANTAWPLVGGIYTNNGDTAFLTYYYANGSNWSVESNNTINQLSLINVAIALSFQQSGQLKYNMPLRFNTTINPRNNNKTIPIAPNITTQ
jgi:prepilin-type N-terminal cleavage/methylation domain-containing protein